MSATRLGPKCEHLSESSRCSRHRPSPQTEQAWGGVRASALHEVGGRREKDAELPSFIFKSRDDRGINFISPGLNLLKPSGSKQVG